MSSMEQKNNQQNDSESSVEVSAASGRNVPLFPANPERIRIHDIASAMSNLCAFSGALDEWYSAAQHAVVSSQIAADRDSDYLGEAFAVRFADAYLGSMPDEVLAWCVENAPGIVKLREHLTKQIFDKFGLRWPIPDEAFEADRAARATEMKEFTRAHSSKWKSWAVEYNFGGSVAESPQNAYELFMNRYNLLRDTGFIR